MAELTAYIGTYGESGVHRLTVDTETGALGAPEQVLAARNAKTLALWPDRLAVPDEDGGRAGMLLAERAVGSLRTLDGAYYERGGACYAAFHEGTLYTANFHEGTVLLYRVEPGGLKLTRRIEIAPHAGCHQVLFHERLLLVPCMNLDAVYGFDLDRDCAEVGRISLPAGSGPRHGVFDRAHARLFLIAELANKVFAFRVNGAELFLEEAHQLSAMPASTSAAIQLSDDERFLYASTRGADLLEVVAVDGFHMRRVQCIPCGGGHPRDIRLTPDGRFLLAANRDTDAVVSFPVDRATGLLGREAGRASIPQAVWVSFETEENT